MTFRRIIYGILFYLCTCSICNAITVCKWHSYANNLYYTNSAPTQINVRKIAINDTPPHIATTNNLSPKIIQAPKTEYTNNTTDLNNNNNTYQAIQITSPQNEETLFYDNGKVTVNIQITPTLKNHDKIALHLDGKVLELPPSTTTATLEYVERGAHQLQAQVIDQNGKILQTSPSIIFYMKHHFQQ